MKSRVTKIVGIGLLAAVLAVPTIVLAHGWGGRHMMGNWGMGPGSMRPYDKGYTTLTPEQKTQLDQLDRRFYDETAELKKELWNKSAELNIILNGTAPDLEKVKKRIVEYDPETGEMIVTRRRKREQDEWEDKF